MNGKVARLPLVDGDDLSSFVHRAVARLVADDDDMVLGRLPLALLVLANSVPGSPRLGEVVATTQELLEHAAACKAGDERSELSFTLTAKAVDEASCGVRRCREGLTRREELNCNREGYDWIYPVAFMVLDEVTFPEFTGISVNMMPFVLGDMASLPEYLHGYWPIIRACVEDQAERGEDRGELGKTWYLTVDEKEIAQDQATHRRGGLHTDSPGVHLPGLTPSAVAPALRGSREEERGRQAAAPSPPDFHPRGLGTCDVHYHGWGIGMVMGEHRHGGIYMASTADDSTEVCNAIVEDPSKIGHLGSCEHLREFLGPATRLRAGELCWFTDRTPHESLPLPAGTRRQFFRLVGSQVGVWYPDHSTANPTGVVPDPKVTRIVGGSKFARERATA